MGGPKCNFPSLNPKLKNEKYKFICGNEIVNIFIKINRKHLKENKAVTFSLLF